MGKNNGLGGSSRRKGKKNRDVTNVHETIFKEDGMGYGYIDKSYGNGRFNVVCEDGLKRMGILRGSLRKKVWIVGGDFILYGIRDFQDDKIDIVHKYTNDDVSKLYRYEEITKNMYDIYTSDVHHLNNKTDEDILFANEEEGDESARLDEWKKISSAADIIENI